MIKLAFQDFEVTREWDRGVKRSNILYPKCLMPEIFLILNDFVS